MKASVDNTRSNRAWLKSYYFLRFAVSAAWVSLAFTLARTIPPLAAVMLVAYPAWDAAANYLDASRSGGLARNKSQLLNIVVSIVTTIAVGVALGYGMHAVLQVFGVWAALAGLFQLVTGVRRWKTYGAQWAMILSGAQSILAGVFMLKMAGGPESVGIANIAPYAAFGAFYFLVSAVWLSERRPPSPDERGGLNMASSMTPIRRGNAPARFLDDARRAVHRASERGVYMRIIPLAALLLATAAPAAAPWTVHPQWVRAHEDFLAGDALRGRGSATHDEAVAAAYVASQFEGYGVQHAPGMSDYLQTAGVVRTSVASPPSLEIADRRVDGVRLIVGSAAEVHGPVVIADSLAAIPDTAAVVVFTATDVPAFDVWRAVRGKHVGLLIAKDGKSAAEWFGQIGGRTSMQRYLAESPPAPRPAFVTLPAAAVDEIKPGAEARLTVPIARDETITSNAIGYLPGTDPKAGVILLSAHLDHLGQTGDGPVMHGANDDSAGTTAVLELARALAAGKPHRRGILFVCYGSEEIGGFGSRYFGAHPPVPLTDIVANIEFEMIGAQDPKLPRGALMMTGFDRSDLGPALQAHGGHVAADPYPQEKFFERSDNYSLALKGVVAHTLSGWAVVPTYHKPTDTIANLDIDYMTSAIQSMIGPVDWLADSSFTPRWTGAGKPTE